MSDGVQLQRLLDSSEEGANDFFALVEQLESLLGGAGVGSSAGPALERIRFRADPGLEFSTSDVSRASFSGDRVEILTTFLGLTGAAGPLPSYFLDAAAQETPDEPSYGALLDVFHHRAISLLYRARQDTRLESWKDTARFQEHLSRALGLTFPAAEQGACPVLEPSVIMALGPWLATGARSASAVEQALDALFVCDAFLAARFTDARASLTEFTGEASTVSLGERVLLGRRNSRLGVESSLGSARTDTSSACRVAIAAGCKKLPTTADADRCARKIDAVLALFVPPSFFCDIALELAADKESQAFGSPLGQRSWLGGLNEQRKTRTVVVARAHTVGSNMNSTKEKERPCD